MKTYKEEYYEKNRDRLIKQKLEYLKRIKYKNEKTPQERKNRYIKRRTRSIYPIEGHSCEFCLNMATEHHHYTKPIEIDKFNYICHDCHRKIEREKRKGGTS